MNKNNKISIPSGTPICNPRTGVINQEWRLWFDKLYKRTGGSSALDNNELSKEINDNIEKIDNIDKQVIKNTQEIVNSNFNISQNTQEINNINNTLYIVINDISTISLQVNKNTNNIIRNTNDINVLKASIINNFNNLGSGAGVYKNKTDTTANFKSLVAGDNIVIDTLTNDNEIIISSSGGGGGGSSTPGIFDIEITGGPVGPGTGSTTYFTVKGGYYWDTAKIINNASRKTVNDFTNQGSGYLNFNQTYYIYYNTASNAIQFTNFSTYTLNGNARLLYILETDGTKISKVTDYRFLNIFIRPKTEMVAHNYYNTSTSINFSFNKVFYQNQVADNTLMTGISNTFPKFVRVQLNLLCINAGGSSGYNWREEAEYITGSSTTGIWGKPYKSFTNGTITAFFDEETKIWNSSTMAWETPVNGHWAIVCKSTLEYV